MTRALAWKDMVRSAPSISSLEESLVGIKTRRTGWNLPEGQRALAEDISTLPFHLGCVVIWEFVDAQGKEFVVIVSFLPNNCFSVTTLRLTGEEQDRFNAGLFLWSPGPGGQNVHYDVARYNAPHSGPTGIHKPYWHIDRVDEKGRGHETKAAPEPDLLAVHSAFLEWASPIELETGIRPAPWAQLLEDKDYKQIAAQLFKEVSIYMPHRELAEAAAEGQTLFDQTIRPPGTTIRR